MKYVASSTPVELVLGDAPTGLVGTLGIRVIQNGSTATTRETAGIIEYPAGSGIYQYTHPGLPIEGYYAAVWDSGLVDPAHTAVEEIVVTTDPPASELTVHASRSFDCVAANWPSGLAGTIRVRIIDNTGATTYGPTSAAISEYPAGSGIYWASLTAPGVDGDYTIVWDDGSDTPGHDTPYPLTVGFAAGGGGGGGIGPGTGSGASMMPWLSFCDTEVANAARVASYIAQGLAPSGNYIGYPSNLPSILWRTRGVDEVFTSPAIDDAPWYDPLVTESGEFLGFIADRVTGLDSTETRTSTASGAYRGGSVLDAATLGERELVLHGYLVASSEPGVEYGRRWLAEVLGANPTSCSDCNLALRVTAPPDDGTNDRQGLWNLYRVALRKLDVTDPFRCPDIREVTVTLVAGDPVLYKDALVCQDHQLISPSASDAGPCLPFDEWYCGPPIDPPICCTISPRKIGRVGGIVTISVEDGYFGGGRVTLNDTCPGVSEADAQAEALVGPLPVGSSLVLDAAQHKVTYVDPSGAAWDGVPYLTLPPGKGVPWLEVAPSGSPVCLCVEPTHPCAGGGGTYITIQTVLWEK